MSTNEIAKYAEKVHEQFPQIRVVEIAKIWCEHQAIPFSEMEFFNTELTNISTSEIVNFILKVHEKFPENSLTEMLKIWTVEEYKPKICQHIYIYILKGRELMHSVQSK